MMNPRKKENVLAITITFLLDTCLADISLRHLKHHIHGMHENKPKLWHKYIAKFLDNRIRNVINHKIKYNHLLFHMLKVSTKFSQHVQKRQANHEFYGTIFSSASGHKDVCFRLMYVVKFQLDQFLRLNITFHKIYFRSNILNGNDDFILIRNLTKHFCGKRLDCSGTTFYGFQPKFSYYPSSIQITIEIKSRKSYEVLYSFQVMDENIIENLLIQDSNEKIGVLSYRIHSISSFIQILFLQVRKNCHIIIKIKSWHQHRYVIFDGPGFLSNVLNPTKSYKTATSSFQCIIQILNENREDGTSTFSYHPKVIPKCQDLILSKVKRSSLLIPNIECHLSPIVMDIHGNNGYQINVTIMQYNSSTPLPPYCTFGGMIVAEQLSNKYVETKPICQHHTQGKSFYSSTSSLILILYWYSAYGQNNLEFMMSQSKCKHVKIHPCAIDRWCSQQTTKCDSYLSNVTRFSNITLIFNGKSLGIESSEEECCVLQITTSYKLWEGTCWFSFISWTGRSVIKEIKLSPYKDDVFDYFTYKEYSSIQDRITETQLQHIGKFHVFSLHKRKNTINQHSAVLRRPLSGYVLIEVTCSSFSNNWLEIIIKRSKNLRPELPVVAQIQPLNQDDWIPMEGISMLNLNSTVFMLKISTPVKSKNHLLKLTMVQGGISLYLGENFYFRHNKVEDCGKEWF